MFDPHHDALLRLIRDQGGEALPLDSDLVERRDSRKNAVISSTLWTLPGLRRWRVTRLDAGDSVQVLNAVAYPDFDREQPLLGIDLLSFAARDKLVAVMDFQPLRQSSTYIEHYLGGLKTLHDSYPTLSPGETMRSYDSNKFFSPYLLFARGKPAELGSVLEEAFQGLLAAYMDLHAACEPQRSLSSEVRELQNDYDQYSAERDPAHGLFVSYFGKDWADRFLHTFLFPGVDGEPQAEVTS